MISGGRDWAFGVLHVRAPRGMLTFQVTQEWGVDNLGIYSLVVELLVPKQIKLLLLCYWLERL
jgi:hypothetical protein